MASNINSSTANQQATRVQRYVDGQLEKTRRQVKSYELIVACLTWAVAVAAFFLAMALIDAWVVSFSTSWRWIALLALILGSAAWLALAIVPLFLRKINLDYAAQMIEQATPDVKNSVLNYSLLRKRDDPINVAVMDAVSRQAAEKLNAIPSDTTIDRSQLIRVGFILVGLMVFAVTYKLLSPRDPLLTVQRILFPGQVLAKPASVQISQVTPGNARVFFGDSLQVAARIKGPHRPEDVRLIISSADGQITDLALPMVLDETGREYQGLISPGEAGIQQPLSYRIEARDGVTPDFKINVKANPSIAIESIDLTPPPYTGLPKRTLTGRGDIEAIEGSEAMIFAVANLPIEVAYIELLNAVPNDDPQNPNATIMKPAAPPIEMRLLPDNRASGRFSATLNSRRTRPNATHYQIRFVSTDGERNETPNVYPIRVTPDLAPEVRIVEPRSRQTNLAVNGRLPIRVEANDLDFAIDSVVLNMDHQGRQLTRQSLDLKSQNGNQRVDCQFLFEPARYRLQPGDQVVFHAVASDNRISIKSLAPDPNVSQTENFTLTITEADSDSDRAQPSEERQPPSEPDDRDNPSDSTGQDSQDDETKAEAQSMDDDSGETAEDRSPENESADQPDASTNDEQGNDGPENNSASPPGEEEEGAQGSDDNQQPPPDGGGSSSSAPEGNQESEQEQNGGSTDQNQGGSSEAEGRNESRNEGVSDQGDPQGSSDRGGNQSDDAGSESGGNRDSSDPNSGGSPDGSGEPGPSGANQNDPNAQASDLANEGGAAEGSQSNGGTRSDPGNTNGDQQGTRDQSLKDGQRERLPEDAHDGEKFEKLDELLKDQKPSSKDSDGQPDGNPQDNQQPNDDSNPNDGQGTGNDPDQGDRRGDGSSDQKSTNQQSPRKQEPTEQRPSDQKGQPPEGTEPSEGSQGSDGSQGSENPEGSNAEPQPSGSSGSPAGNQNQPSNKQEQPSDGSESSSGSGADSGSDPSDSNQQPSDSQSQSGANSNTGQAGQPSLGSSNSSQTADANGQSNQPNEGVTTSGQQGSGASSDQPNDEQLEKEQADLEHAKKATDLVLNKLEDQLNNPDPDLLDKMNWTEQDLREFLDRWKRMKQNAQTGDPNAQRQYEEAIKSLGLRPNNRARTSKNRDADAAGLNQDSSVIEPPADLAPDFNDFLRDRNRVR